jgi:hypothetical protein
MQERLVEIGEESPYNDLKAYKNLYEILKLSENRH